MSAKKCWMASTQTEVGSFLFPPSCLSSFNVIPRCKGQKEAARAQWSCLCPAIPQALMDPKAALGVSFAVAFLPYHSPVLNPALLELSFVTLIYCGVPKMCPAFALPRSSLVRLCYSQPPCQGDSDRFPCPGAVPQHACPGFPLCRHLPPATVGFLSAAFLRDVRPQANAQPSGGSK